MGINIENDNINTKVTSNSRKSKFLKLGLPVITGLAIILSTVLFVFVFLTKETADCIDLTNAIKASQDPSSYGESDNDDNQKKEQEEANNNDSGDANLDFSNVDFTDIVERLNKPIEEINKKMEKLRKDIDIINAKFGTTFDFNDLKV